MLNQEYQGRRLVQPQPVSVELYVRNRLGETFYVSSLEEAIKHLLSNEGYRLTIYPAGSDTHSVVVRRTDRELSVNVRAPGLSPVSPPNLIETEEEMMQRLSNQAAS